MEHLCSKTSMQFIESKTVTASQSVWDSTLIGRTINFSYQMLWEAHPEKPHCRVWQRNQAWLVVQMEIDAAMTSPIHEPLRQYKEDNDLCMTDTKTALWLSAHSILYHYKLDDPMLSNLQEQLSDPITDCPDGHWKVDKQVDKALSITYNEYADKSVEVLVEWRNFVSQQMVYSSIREEFDGMSVDCRNISHEHMQCIQLPNVMYVKMHLGR
ncbi:hypothetical protein J3A83DRAFT_4193251 [Scleroderma citrinum]